MAFVTPQKTFSQNQVCSPKVALITQQKSMDGVRHGFGARYLKKRETGKLLFSSDQQSFSNDGASTAAGTQCQSPQSFISPTSKGTVRNMRSVVGTQNKRKFDSIVNSPMSPLNGKYLTQARRDPSIKKETSIGFLPRIKCAGDHNLLGKLDSYQSLGKSLGAHGKFASTS